MPRATRTEEAISKARTNAEGNVYDNLRTRVRAVARSNQAKINQLKDQWSHISKRDQRAIERSERYHQDQIASMKKTLRWFVKHEAKAEIVNAGSLKSTNRVLEQMIENMEEEGEILDELVAKYGPGRA